MGIETLEECPVCRLAGCRTAKVNRGPWTKFVCANCGAFQMSHEALVICANKKVKDRAVLANQIWINQKKFASEYVISSSELDPLGKYDLPSPAEQINMLIGFLGEQLLNRPGEEFQIRCSELCAKIGAVTVKDVEFIIECCQGEELLRPIDIGLRARFDAQNYIYKVKLSLKGWQYYENLRRGKLAEHTAFMAMPFGNQEVKEIVDRIFRTAVEQTGVRLKRLDDEPAAGQIDDRMRVEILRSRFVIADLTDENRGAYWEAGYAEGLGKPVIYTCHKGYFDAKGGTHFDTNHRQTVLWESTNEEKAAEDLKASIRATFPFEAIMPND